MEVEGQLHCITVFDRDSVMLLMNLKRAATNVSLSLTVCAAIVLFNASITWTISVARDSAPLNSNNLRREKKNQRNKINQSINK